VAPNWKHLASLTADDLQIALLAEVDAMIAEVADTRIGYTATGMALISLWSTLRMHRQVPRHHDAILQFALAMVAYLD
jgi:hypothetical protein